ncbi:MAG TPA: FHA domain-containing protein [Halomonas sp.]|nr:FHA domain-containing protein [Halomonas sp.]
MSADVPKLTLSFAPEFGDSVWAGIDYELAAPEQETGEWVIGRSPTAQITLNLRTISVKHAVISYSYSNDHWFISDLGSQNGTFLNGKRVEPPRRPEPIKIGDRIDLGPRAKIQVVENAQDTLREEYFGPPTIASTTPIKVLPPEAAPPPAPPPPPPPPAATNADNINFALKWLATPTTWLGGIVRFFVAALVALVVVLIFDN